MKKNSFHLTYCTNIHPSNTWEESFENIKKICLSLRKRFSKKYFNDPSQSSSQSLGDLSHNPDHSTDHISNSSLSSFKFGIGLRLSNKETLSLQDPVALSEFKDFLLKENCYVFTINGFPYGDFHRTKIKEFVHSPDWLTRDRVEYTKRLVDILAFILPEDLEEGGISTNPLTYRHWIKNKENLIEVFKKTTLNLLSVVEHCLQTYEKTKKIIHIDIEPEPDGLLQTTEEMVSFFKEYLFDFGAKYLAQKLNVSFSEAKKYISRHLRVCFDICHTAVLYEEPASVLELYSKNNIRVGKIQISSALHVDFNQDSYENQQKINLLSQFADSTYLHQVCEYDKKSKTTKQYVDLQNILPASVEGDISPHKEMDTNDFFEKLVGKSWRIHFHVPIFMESYQKLHSTQNEIKKTFAKLKESDICSHLEIETYTWDVLPQSIKTNLVDLIEAEYNWVLSSL